MSKDSGKISQNAPCLDTRARKVFDIHNSRLLPLNSFWARFFLLNFVKYYKGAISQKLREIEIVENLILFINNWYLIRLNIAYSRSLASLPLFSVLLLISSFLPVC